MKQSDFERFAKALIACSEVYGKSLSTDGVKFYWVALQNYEYTDIEKAFGVILRTHRYPTMPTPAQFIEAMDNSGVRAIQAERDLEYLQIVYGSSESVEIDDPALVATIDSLGGWVRFNDRLREGSKFQYDQRIRDFKLLYVHHLRERTRPASMKLIGRYETDNVKQVTLIGKVKQIEGPK